MENFIKRNSLYITIITLLTISLIGYRQFCGGERIYALVSDTFIQSIPEMQNVLSSVMEGRLPLYSFSKGLGNQMTVGNPNWVGDLFTWLAFILGGSRFTQWLGIIVIIKIVLSGTFFFMFLDELKVSPCTKILFSVLYAFNGHMILRGMWTHYATEVVFVALWLWALEKYYNRSNKYFFPVAFALLLCSRSVSYVFIYSGLSFVYLLLRKCFSEGFSWKNIWKEIYKFIPIYFLGLAFSAILLLPGAIALLDSSRLTGTNYLRNLSVVVDLDAIVTVFTKSFSYSILGTISTSGSSKVILEDQVLYCGILCMLLFPQIFIMREAPKREKRTLGVMFALILVYYLFPIVRIFLNAFKGDYYKTSSYWTIIFLIMLGVYVFDNYEKNRYCLSKKNVLIVSFVYCGVFFLIYHFWPGELRLQSLMIVLIFITTYLLVIFMKTSFFIQFGLLFFLCCAELTLGICIAVRAESLLNIDMDDVYNPRLNAAVDILQEIDNDSFYRVMIDIDHVNFYNIPQAVEYFGTVSYSSILNESTEQFYDMFDIGRLEQTAVLRSFNERTMLDNMIGAKYYIKLNTDTPVLEDYELVYSNDDLACEIYRNNNYLPIGYVYHKVSDESSATELENSQKDLLIMQSILLKRDDIVNIQNELDPLDFELVDNADIVSFSDEMIEQFREEGLDITFFNQNKIEGNLLANKDGVTFFSIPYDRGWSISVDGRRVKAICANGGFLAIPIQAGQHEVRLQYVTPGLIVGVLVSVCSAVILLVLIKKRRWEQQ